MGQTEQGGADADQITGEAQENRARVTISFGPAQFNEAGLYKVESARGGGLPNDMRSGWAMTCGAEAEQLPPSTDGWGWLSIGCNVGPTADNEIGRQLRT